jgi:hypothetical protein
MGSRQKKTGYRDQLELQAQGKETYEVKSDNVIVAFLGVKLDSEATRVTGFVGVFTANCHSRETHEDWSLLADAAKEVSFLKSS